MRVSSRRLVQLAAALAVLGLALALWPRERLSAEDAVRARVLELTQAAERKDVSAIQDALSERFTTAEGWTRDDVRRLLGLRVLRGTWVRVFVTDLEVREVTPAEVEVGASFVFGRSEAQRLQDLGRDSVLEAYRIDATFVLEDGDVWRVVSARHRHLAPHELL